MCKLKFKPSANNCWTCKKNQIRNWTRINYPLFPLRCCSRIVVSVVKIKRAAAAIVNRVQASCFKDRSSASCKSRGELNRQVRVRYAELRKLSSSDWAPIMRSCGHGPIGPSVVMLRSPMNGFLHRPQIETQKLGYSAMAARIRQKPKVGVGGSLAGRSGGHQT